VRELKHVKQHEQRKGVEVWIHVLSAEMELAQSGNRQHRSSRERSDVVLFAEAIVTDSVDENGSSTAAEARGETLEVTSNFSEDERSANNNVTVQSFNMTTHASDTTVEAVYTNQVSVDVTYRTESSCSSVLSTQSQPANPEDEQNAEHQNQLCIKKTLATLKETLERRPDPSQVISSLTAIINIFSKYLPEGDKPLTNDQVENCLFETVSCVISSMKVVAGNDAVAVHACRALSCIISYSSLDSPMEGQDEACHVIVVLGGIDSIIKCMIDFQSSCEAVRFGMEVLKNIVKSSNSTKTAIVSAGDYTGINVIVQSMFIHQSCSSIQECGCVLLWSMSFGDEANQRAIEDAFGVAAIITSMTSNPEHQKVQEFGCGALHTLCHNPAIRQNVVSNGGVECATEVLKRHAANPCLVQKASTVLISCFVDPQNNSHVSDVPELTLEALFHVLSENMLSESDGSGNCAQKQTCIILQILCGNPANVLRMKQCNDAVILLLEVERKWPLCGETSRFILGQMGEGGQ